MFTEMFDEMLMRRRERIENDIKQAIKFNRSEADEWIEMVNDPLALDFSKEFRIAYVPVESLKHYKRMGVSERYLELLSLSATELTEAYLIAKKEMERRAKNISILLKVWEKF